jgi:hypothetical protein
MWWAEECGHYECGFPVPATCLVGAPACDCGLDRAFVAGVGCRIVPDCGAIDPLPEDELCAATGGSWENICCHTECGVPCPLPCISPACNCGPDRVFDPVRGCVVDVSCMERTSGETCNERSRCEGGTICCQSCGGAGCFGDPICSYPVCDDDPFIDECGNDSRVP